MCNKLISRKLPGRLSTGSQSLAEKGDHKLLEGNEPGQEASEELDHLYPPLTKGYHGPEGEDYKE